MSHNHFVGNADLLVNRRAVAPHTRDIATACRVRYHLSCLSDLPVMFADVYGCPFRFLVQDVFAVDAWPNSRILFSLGQWEELRDKYGRPLVTQTDTVLRFRHGCDVADMPYDCQRTHTVTPLLIGQDVIDVVPPSHTSRSPEHGGDETESFEDRGGIENNKAPVCYNMVPMTELEGYADLYVLKATAQYHADVQVLADCDADTKSSLCLPEATY